MSKTEDITRTIRYSLGGIKFHAIMNKKPFSNAVFIKYNTSEGKLLNIILQKFIEEKVLTGGININNQIANAVATENGILLTIPDNKIFGVIAQVQNYIKKTKLNTAQQKCVGKGSYRKLFSDIKDFDVLLVGKCRLTIKSLADGKDKKIQNFVKAMDAIKVKPDNDFDVVCTCYQELKTELSDEAKFYFSICYADCPFVFHGKTLSYCDCPCCFECGKIFANSFRSKIKAFQTQFGNTGAPAANDAGKKKYKEKCEKILSSVNLICDIYGGLFGFKYQFSSAEELKEVNADSISEFKSLKFA